MAPPMRTHVETVLRHKFRDANLAFALLPPSPSNPEAIAAFQRLEFLGDRVLGLLLSEILFHEHPDAREDGLAIRLAHLSSTETLALIARESALDQAVTRDMAPRPFPSHLRILADCVEAALGALWIDGGIDAARAFIKRHFMNRIVALTEAPQDPKTALQEWTQGRKLGLPRYELLRTEGTDHEPIFEIEASIALTCGRCVRAIGRKSSKRAAEKSAAKRLLERLHELAA